MVYLLIAPVVLLMLRELRFLLMLRKHDRVLFPLCQIRRDVMQLLRDQGVEMTRDDYIYARSMLTSVSHVVSIYGDHKAKVFNLRSFLRFVKEYKATARELSQTPRTKHAALNEIERRLNAAMLKGFLAYTPFVKSEITLRVFLAVMQLLTHLGFKMLAERMKDVRELAAIVRGQTTDIAGEGALSTA